jgi:hypothetical protein
MRRFYSLTLALLLAAGVWFSPITHGYNGNDDRQAIHELSGVDLAASDSVVPIHPNLRSTLPGCTRRKFISTIRRI